MIDFELFMKRIKKDDCIFEDVSVESDEIWLISVYISRQSWFRLRCSLWIELLSMASRGETYLLFNYSKLIPGFWQLPWDINN